MGCRYVIGRFNRIRNRIWKNVGSGSGLNISRFLISKSKPFFQFSLTKSIFKCLYKVKGEFIRLDPEAGFPADPGQQHPDPQPCPYIMGQLGSPAGVPLSRKRVHTGAARRIENKH